MYFKIDYREQALIAHLEATKPNFEYKIENLALGDIQLFEDGGEHPIWIFERKTISDLCASLTDGRYKEQMERLKQSNCKVCYIFEGTLPSFCSNNSNFQYSNNLTGNHIQGCLSSLLFHHNIPWFMIENIEAYPSFLTIALEKVKKEKVEDQKILIQSKVNIQTEEDFGTAALSNIKGISPQKAKAILKEFGSLETFIEQIKQDGKNTIKRLSEIKINNRRIGKKIGEHLQTLFTIKNGD